MTMTKRYVSASDLDKSRWRRSNVDVKKKAGSKGGQNSTCAAGGKRTLLLSSCNPPHRRPASHNRRVSGRAF